MQINMRSLPFPLFLSTLFLGMSATGAHAYLDGGTGSMLLQLLLGGVAGLAIAGKLYWYRLLAFLGVKSKTDVAEARARNTSETRTQADR
jgi:hypothetical protein